MARINTVSNQIIEYRIMSDPHPEVRMTESMRKRGGAYPIMEETWACIAEYHKGTFAEGHEKLLPLLEVLEKIRPRDHARTNTCGSSIALPNM